MKGKTLADFTKRNGRYVIDENEENIDMVNLFTSLQGNCGRRYDNDFDTYDFGENELEDRDGDAFFYEIEYGYCNGIDGKTYLQLMRFYEDEVITCELTEEQKDELKNKYAEYMAENGIKLEKRNKYAVFMVGEKDIAKYHSSKAGKLYRYEYDRRAEDGSLCDQIENLSDKTLYHAKAQTKYAYGTPLFYIPEKDISDEEALLAIKDYVSANTSVVYGFHLAEKLTDEEKMQIYKKEKKKRTDVGRE